MGWFDPVEVEGEAEKSFLGKGMTDVAYVMAYRELPMLAAEDSDSTFTYSADS